MQILKKPYRILVVDDDEEDYLLISDFLSEFGEDEYHHEWAPSYSKGLEIMKEERHDLYLIDNFLGAGTGIELISIASQMGCKTPKILLTGVGNREIDMQAIKAGAYDYLPKTMLSSEMLERTLRHSIERYEQSMLLENEQSRFKTLFDQSIDPIYITDESWNITEANSALLDLFKIERNDLHKFSLQQLFQNKEQFEEFKNFISKEGEILNFSCTLSVQNSDKKLTCLVSSTPVQSQGMQAAHQGVIRDITQLKKAEKELMYAEQINLTGRMARMIAHEVRNPLTNINLATDELYSQLQEIEKDTLYTEIIKRSSERINNLISDLLNSTKLATPVFNPTEMETLIKEVVLICDDRLQLKKVELQMLGIKGSTIINSDKEKLRIALVNIVINATEAMQETANPVLKIELSSTETEVSVRITDNGRGMDEHTQKHLFEAFFTGRNGGMGLGMTAVQNIILQHRGSIQVESELGKGTTFIITLPRD